jgi:hypothetical protein
VVLWNIIAVFVNSLSVGAYLFFAREEKPAIPIVAHGVCDTIDIALLLLGKYPGL